jgi:undecaprenyl-diphosphatase
MTLWEAAILGLIQGVTEFLPISSSGHLSLSRSLLGLKTDDLTFEVIVHAGTLLAVLIALRARIATLLGGCLRREQQALKMAGLILLGTLPAGVVGILFESTIEQGFSHEAAVGAFLILTGFVLWSTRHRRGTRSDVRTGDAASIGFAQAFAILPGVSRSGTTIAVGIWLGMEATEAATFSFLLSIPVILGATVLKLGDMLATPPSPDAIGALAVGFAAAFVSGLIAIRWLLALLARGRLDRFAWYCWAVGVLALVTFL